MQSTMLRPAIAAGSILLAAFLAGCGPTAAVVPPKAPAGTIAVDVRDYEFAPLNVAIGAGSTVAFLNGGHAPHTATSAGAFDTGEIASGAVATQTFDTPGTYAFVCAYHPQMTGTIVVSAGSSSARR